MPQKPLPTTALHPPRRSSRARKATTRYLEGRFETLLPRLSLALGVGASTADDDDDAGHEAASLSDDEGVPATNCGGEDEMFVSEDDCLGQGRGKAAVAVCTVGFRRSERERRATRRFEEGWFGEKLPRLSEALGVGKGC